MNNQNDDSRIYVSLSFSVPPEMEAPINQRAADLGMSRSAYLRKLVVRDLRDSGHIEKDEWIPDAPPRVGRSKRKTK